MITLIAQPVMDWENYLTGKSVSFPEREFKGRCNIYLRFVEFVFKGILKIELGLIYKDKFVS